MYTHRFWVCIRISLVRMHTGLVCIRIGSGVYAHRLVCIRISLVRMHTGLVCIRIGSGCAYALVWCVCTLAWCAYASVWCVCALVVRIHTRTIRIGTWCTYTLVWHVVRMFTRNLPQKHAHGRQNMHTAG